MPWLSLNMEDAGLRPSFLQIRTITPSLREKEVWLSNSGRIAPGTLSLWLSKTFLMEKGMFSMLEKWWKDPLLQRRITGGFSGRPHYFLSFGIGPQRFTENLALEFLLHHFGRKLAEFSSLEKQKKFSISRTHSATAFVS